MLFNMVTLAAHALLVECLYSCSHGPGRVLAWWRRRQLLRMLLFHRRLFWFGLTAPLVSFLSLPLAFCFEDWVGHRRCIHWHVVPCCLLVDALAVLQIARACRAG